MAKESNVKSNRLGFLIKEARRILGFDQEYVGKLVGRSKKQISNYETGFSTVPTDVLFKLIPLLEEGFKTIGVFEEVSKSLQSKGNNATDNNRTSTQDIKNIITPENNFFFFRFYGNTFPYIKPQTVILCEKTASPYCTIADGEIYLVRNGDGLSEELRRIQKIGSSKLKLIYDNPAYESEIVDIRKIEILGKALFAITPIE